MLVKYRRNFRENYGQNTNLYRKRTMVKNQSKRGAEQKNGEKKFETKIFECFFRC